MAIVNVQILKTLIERAGGTIKVAYEADVGHSTIEKLMAGSYQSIPRKKLRDKLCRYLNVREAELFPFVATKSKGRAS